MHHQTTKTTGNPVHARSTEPLPSGQAEPQSPAHQASLMHDAVEQLLVLLNNRTYQARAEATKAGIARARQRQARTANINNSPGEGKPR